MIFRKKIAFLTVLFTLLTFPVFSQNQKLLTENNLMLLPSYLPRGINLCDTVYQFLKKNSFNPSIQALVSGSSNGENLYYPYNIVLSFNNNFNNEVEDPNNLIFVFSMEDACKFPEIISFVCNCLKENQVKSTVLISYGENQIKFLDDINYIYGHEVFIKKLNTNENNNVFIFNLSSTKNQITAGANGYSSPSWMIKNTYNSFAKNRIVEYLPVYLLSQPLKFKFNDDFILGNFLQENISAIKINFNSNFQYDNSQLKKIKGVIQDIILDYNSSKNNEKDFHSLMFRIWKHIFWFTEYKIVCIIIFNLLISLIFIIVLSFLHKNLKIDTWNELKKNWYTIPGTYILSAAGFFIGKYLYQTFGLSHQNINPFECFLLQLIISSVLVSALYALEIFFHKGYGEKSLDYLVLLSTFVNQFVFSLIDISLFPIFMFICVCSIIAFATRKNGTHIILFLLMTSIFLPYINRLYETSNFQTLKNYLIYNDALCLIIPMVLHPIYLLLFRIFIATRKKISSKRIFTIMISVTHILVFVILIVFNSIVFSKNLHRSYADSIQNNNFILQENLDEKAEDYISIQYSDKRIFNEIIRTVTIISKDSPELLEFSIYGVDSTPVLYSDNDYIELSNDDMYKVSFQIPSQPENTLSFTYCAGKVKQEKESVLCVEGIYKAAQSELTTKIPAYIIRKREIITNKKGK